MDWAGKRVLVTGATGFIGRHLVRRLVEAGASVYGGTSSEESRELAARLPVPVQWLVFDLRDATAIRAAVARADAEIIFHLAAVGVADTSVHPELALTVNAGGTLRLLEALRERSVHRVVLTGTCYEYGAREATEGLDPFNAYAASKVAAWAFGRMYWRVHGLPVVTVRPFQVYGPGQPPHVLIPAAIGAALSGKDFAMTPGEQERDFIYVEDVVEGMMAAAVAPGIGGESLDLGTGTAYPVLRVVERIWELAEGTGSIRPDALPYRPAVVMRIVADAERAAALTGWRAQVGLAEGLGRTVRSYSQVSES